MAYRGPAYSPRERIFSLLIPIQLSQLFSRAGLRSPRFLAAEPKGHVKLVPTTPPTPMVEAKSSFVISTWSPKYATRSPWRALSVLPFVRTCHADSGSDATDMFRKGRVKKE